VLTLGDDPPDPPAVLTLGDDPPDPPAVLTLGDDPPDPPAGARPTAQPSPCAWTMARVARLTMASFTSSGRSRMTT
jgi:hypothetical protein